MTPYRSCLKVFSCKEILFLVCTWFFPGLSDAAIAVADPTYETLYKSLNYTFKNPAVLELALIHHTRDLGESVSVRGNERLEFLGDAVLDFVMKLQVLKRSYGPQLGTLNINTAALTENKVLVKIANVLDLVTFADMPGGLSSVAKACKLSPLDDAKADLVEAVIGAIYVDSGDLSPIEALVERFWFSAGAPENYANTLLKLPPVVEGDIAQVGYCFRSPWYLPGSALPMEPLGKSILKFVANEFLYRRFPEFPEGELAARTNILHTKRNIEAIPFPGSDASLSLIGGIYMDGGLEVARRFVLWHWTGSTAPVEIRRAIQKVPNSKASESSVVYPLSIKEAPPKNFLQDILTIMGRTPTFDTKEISPSPASRFTSRVLLEDGSVISKEASAIQKRETEKEAAQDALEELSAQALLALDLPTLSEPLLTANLKLLEGFLINLRIDFGYHQIAMHPSEEKYRIEVQGRGLMPTVAEGPKVVAQYHAIGGAILWFLGNEFANYQVLGGAPVLELNPPLKFYQRFLRKQLQSLGGVIEVSPIAKSKEKLSPLLTYEVRVPSLSVVVPGQGYCTDTAELDGLVRALEAVKLGGAEVLS